MLNNKNHITVFEHQSIKLDQIIGEEIFDESRYLAMQRYYGQQGVPYFSLIHKGIRFNEYVGVLQVGNLVIEVLPKADSVVKEGEEEKWRKILIGMLKAVGSFEIKATSNSNLKTKPNTILDLYFEMFITEVEYLLRNGLIKQYRKKDENAKALKGSLMFSKNIQHNLVHQERFYVNHSSYDFEHKLHFILHKTIRLLHQINTNSKLQSRIGSLLLNFPEMPDIKVTDTTFEKIVYGRKNLSYKKAIDISKMLLLQYHPDVIHGKNDVLAIMFDMNKLWEKFVYVSLKKGDVGKNNTIVDQVSRNFWKPENGYSSKIQPDIWIKNNTENYILDTKWKNLNGNNPSPDDLRQMFVYHEYFEAKKVALVYPGNSNSSNGKYYEPKEQKLGIKQCGVVLVEVLDNIREWQKAINNQINTWIEC